MLMAADILIYRSNLVPVGKDQVQHLEMTQDMAGKFNRAFGEVFPIPNYRLDKESKVPGTDGQKMSKSYGNTIEIFAEGKPLEKTVMSIKTDSTPVWAAAKIPETCNVFALYSLFATDEEKAALAAALSRRRDRLRRGQEDAAGEDRRLLRAGPRAAQAAGRTPGLRRGRARAGSSTRPGGGAQEPWLRSARRSA